MALEKLNVKNKPQNHSLVKSISDVVWSQLAQPLTVKAGYAGREVLLIDPYGTWLRCSGCGTVVRKSLYVRVHACSVCGLESYCDIKVAISIFGIGLVCLGNVLRSHPKNGVE